MRKKYPALRGAAPLCLAALLPLSAAAGEKNSGVTQQQANDIAELLTAPVRQVVKPAADKAGKDLYEALQYANGAEWALWDLACGLKAAAGARPEPDCALAETYVRLRMRSNTGDLCRLFGGGCKAYPSDAALSAAGASACGEIRRFAAKLPAGADPALRRHRARLDGFLETARKKAAFGQPAAGAEPEPPPPTAAEQKYRALAVEKRRGGRFMTPPWR